MHLASSVQLIFVFLVGGIPQLCTSHSPLNLFYTHAQHWMIETARRDEYGVRPSAMVSWAHAIMQHHHRFEVQTSQSEALYVIHGHLFSFPGVRKFKCWRCMFSLATDVPDVSTKLWSFVGTSQSCVKNQHYVAHSQACQCSSWFVKPVLSRHTLV